MLLLCAPSMAQKTVGDFIESRSYNEARRGAERVLRYQPDGNDFVCVNGINRYSRALYGGYTDYRIETSDRPIFAIYKKRDYRNIRFRAVYEGRELQLDSTNYCEARYSDGTRRYVLADKSWGAGRLYVEVVALTDEEGAIWKFRADNFKSPLSVKALVCNIANPKLHRNGDIGADKPGCFEPAAGDAGLTTSEWTAADGKAVSVTSYFAVSGSAIKNIDSRQAAKRFDATRDYFKTLAPCRFQHARSLYKYSRRCSCGGCRRRLGRTDMAARLYWLAHAAGRLACRLSGRRARMERPCPLSLRRIRQEPGDKG